MHYELCIIKMRQPTLHSTLSALHLKLSTLNGNVRNRSRRGGRGGRGGRGRMSRRSRRNRSHIRMSRR